MQGESDATQSASANAYEANLTAFVDQLRDDLGAPGLPFLIGRINKFSSGLPFVSQVRAAQVAVAQADPAAFLVDTDDLPLKSDRIHFTADGQVTLGDRFAKAWLPLKLILPR